MLGLLEGPLRSHAFTTTARTSTVAGLRTRETGRLDPATATNLAYHDRTHHVRHRVPTRSPIATRHIGAEDVWSRDLQRKFRELTGYEGSPPLFHGEELQEHLMQQLQEISLELNQTLFTTDPTCTEDDWPVWLEEALEPPCGMKDTQFWPVSADLRSRYPQLC